MPDHAIGVLFHGIGTPGRALEPGEAPYWISVETFEDVLDRVAASRLRERIQLSFDDGNASDHDIALPRLLQRGLTADFFVLAGRIDTPGSLSAAQIRAMAAAGMGIGSHGVAHLDWRSLSDAELEAEAAGSRDLIGQVLGRPVTTAGIPFGSYDDRVLTALRRAGYEAVYSSDRGLMDPTAFLRPRNSVRAGLRPRQITALVEGRLSLPRRIYRSVAFWRNKNRQIED
jgi:peptidoglycan/xylan/chitin deacetylase (PgdA/CDA1 family)